MAPSLTAADILQALDTLARQIPPSLSSAGARYRSQVPRTLEVEDGFFCCDIRVDRHRAHEVVIDFDRQPLAGGCSCQGFRVERPCVHLAAVVDELRSRLGPGADPLAGALARVEDALAGLTRTRTVPEERVIGWELAFDVASLVVQPVLKRRRRSGELGASRPLALQQLAGYLTDGADPRDTKIAALLQATLPTYVPRWATNRLPAIPVLELLEGHPRVYVAGSDATLTRAVAGIRAVANADGSIRIAASLDGRPVVPGPGTGSITLEGLAAFDAGERRVRFAPCSVRMRSLLASVASLPERVPRDVAAALLDRIGAAAPALPLVVPVELEGEPVAADARVVLRITPASSGAAVEVRFRPVSGAPLVEPGAAPARLVGTHEGKRRVAARDLAGEAARARDVSCAVGLAVDERLGWTAFLETDDDVLDLLGRLEGELPAPVVVEWPESEKRRVVPNATTTLRIAVEARQDWFGVTGGLEVEGDLVALGQLLTAAREGRRYAAVGKGRFVELARVFGGRLEELALVTRDARGKVQLPRAAAPLAVDLLEGVELTRAAPSWVELARRVRELASFEPALPEGLAADLRPYQVEGYRWLARLAAIGVGGCLADDMGTGKTVQAIAALVARKAEGPALVLAPTSVGFNWLRELERFAPGLRGKSYRTANRAALLESAGPGDVVVASYGLLRQDGERLSKVSWGTVVLDEAQAIKNAATETAKAVRALEAKWTVALTGTPVENHLGELWSLFHAISPGLLGSWEQFAERFARPIERDRSNKRRAALARVVRPFVLRRTKQDVLEDLPPRTEVQRDVVLSKAERALYEKARAEALARLANPAQGEDQRFKVLAELTRLRQLACHARLVEPAAPRVSAKLAVLLEQLEGILENGHRALVFSQFTRHLDLVGEALAERGVKALRLDGATPARERERLVGAFQAGEAPVFLISLKAGGTGLNLTAADYVFHLDPWWNPAVEDQAADRAHRIGQERPVTVVRLVARGTIEEKVLALHGEKRELVAGILDGSERAGKLSTSDLLELLREGAREAVGDDAGDEPAGEESGPRAARDRRDTQARLI